MTSRSSVDIFITACIVFVAGLVEAAAVISPGINIKHPVRPLFLHSGQQQRTDSVATVDHLPHLRKVSDRRETSTVFSGKFNGSLLTSFAYDSLEKQEQNDVEKRSKQLSWETTWLQSGRRKTTAVKLEANEASSHSTNQHSHSKKRAKRAKGKFRGRREVFGFDDRHFVPSNTIGQQMPFSSSVKISTGCTGILVSPRHVLTAAHCVHNQTDYVEGLQSLRVGFINSQGRVIWADAQFVRISKGWVNGGQLLGPLYDYALIKLKKRHNRPYINISPSDDREQAIGERLYFTSFEDDKPSNTRWYRSCSIEDEDNDFFYHFCDARRGSSGSGVYAWKFNDKKRIWERKVIGVFSGNRWKNYDDWFLSVRNFNVAVRITPDKFVQICEWMGKQGETLCNLK